MKLETLTRQLKTQNQLNNAGINKLKVVLITSVFLALSACGSSSTVDDSKSNGSGINEINDSIEGSAADLSLIGTWVYCTNDFYGTNTESGTEYNSASVSYIFTADQFERTLRWHYGSDCVTGSVSFNRSGEYEFVGNSISDSGLAIKQMNMLREMPHSNRYTIVYTETPNQLLFGTYGNDNTESKRPTALDFEAIYFRQ